MENGKDLEQGEASSPVHDHATVPASNSKGGTSAAQVPTSGTENPTLADTLGPAAAALIKPVKYHDKPPVIEQPTAVEGSSEAEAPTAADVVPTSSIKAPVSSAKPPMGLGGILLRPGMVLDNRYEIIQLLGEGGMGAVYKARDRELERTIALKVIRSDLTSNAEILRRFKQELILARQITDRNIIRIFDLGEANGIKFITMEYVEGQSLYQMLRQRGKLTVEEVVDIMEQVFRGLRAAHREGVIHRDLKPGNIMRDQQSRVVVMDFGLARTVEGDGMTRTGAMLGTMEYMSPEQAQAKVVDARSEIFTVGLICYELLSGKMPFQADNAVASLLRRTRERVVPISEIRREVPGVLSNIISKCLERDPGLRYQTAQAVLDDLHAWQGKGGKTRISASTPSLLLNRVRDLPWKQASAAVLALALIAVVTWYMSIRGRVPISTEHAPVSVLVADFQNTTSDTAFDGTLEPAFNLALEGASFITAYSRGDAHKAAEELKAGVHEMDESLARLVAQREGISVVVAGAIGKDHKGYKITARQ